uniref:Uncharacterized protein n=1 Tax=Nelumbo nucifera TaxID=4432 RepID=A0A822Z351_NELNU|nr:TPA_asm: hypothetical protein HUJ06_013433 [Nelumbo nucifera]
MKGIVHQVKTRKLMTADTVQDYDYPGPNPKHDPRNKGKPPVGGGGFRTP